MVFNAARRGFWALLLRQSGPSICLIRGRTDGAVCINETKPKSNCDHITPHYTGNLQICMQHVYILYNSDLLLTNVFR